jgi:hypothetical protein
VAILGQTQTKFVNYVFKPSTTPGVVALAPFRILGCLGPTLNLASSSLRLSRRDDALILRSLSMLAVMLTPLAVLAAALGVWRIAADPGWTSHFFIARGLLSHCQVWFTMVIVVRASSQGLNRWLDKQQ